jgi:folate-dependent phosphoribosylglycinamide formyltransferase PurN
VKLFIVAVDEPIYLNPYLCGVIDRCSADVVGVGIYRPRRVGWTRARVRRIVSHALLAPLVFSPGDLAAIAWGRLCAAVGRPSRRSLSAICASRGVPCTTVASANAPEFAARLRELDVDVLLHQTPEILRRDVLRAPKIGILNRHLSMLPDYRGAWPVFWQFVNSESCLGITIHMVDEGIDTGPVLEQAAVERRPDETLVSAHRRLFTHAVGLTADALARLARGETGARPHSASTVCYRTPSPSEVLAFMFSRRRWSLSVRA